MSQDLRRVPRPPHRFTRDLEDRGMRRVGGTCLAIVPAVKRLWLVLSCATAMNGCILRDFEYDPQANVPPSVHGSTETPMDRVRIVDLDVIPGGDGGPTNNIVFVGELRDANVNDPIAFITFIDRNLSAPRIVDDGDAQPVVGGDSFRRPFETQIPRSVLTLGCHAVEVHASSRFDGVANPTPHDENDLGIGVWWIAATSSSSPDVDMLSCGSYR
jgi:hypothetical protein